MDRISALRKLKHDLWEAGIEEADAEARQALSCLLSVDMSQLFLTGGQEVSPGTEQALLDLVRRRREGEPLAYILGERWFYGRPFRVTPHVLIPRQETELLVEEALKVTGKDTAYADICTGSGCVAVTVALEAGCAAYGVDISPEALAVARQNGEALGAPVEWLEGDLLEPLAGPLDVITANPPYVTPGEYATLTPEVKREPALALLGGEDGLALYRRLVPQAAARLRPGGWLLCEMGCTQGDGLCRIYREAGFSPQVVEDLTGRPRIVVGQLR